MNIFTIFNRNEIIKEMSLYSIDQHSVLFQGEFSLYLNNKKIKVFKIGDSFGELALLHNAPRSGTVRADTFGKLWCMERKNFKKIIDHINTLNHQENKKYIAQIPFLSNMNN